MTETSKTARDASPHSQAASPARPQGERISRRLFGKLIGVPTLLASTATVSAVTACSDSGTPAPDPDAARLARGDFVATISSYFDWVHSSEYNDPYKLPQPTFVDVKLGVTPYAKEIETAAEEAVVSNALGYFYPDQPVTREEAAEIYVKAFKIPASSADALSGFGDAGVDRCRPARQRQRDGGGGLHDAAAAPASSPLPPRSPPARPRRSWPQSLLRRSRRRR